MVLGNTRPHRYNWKIGAMLAGLAACSRTGLLPGEIGSGEFISQGNPAGASGAAGSGHAGTASRGGNTGAGGTSARHVDPFIPTVPPSTASRRWIVAQTKDDAGNAQLFALRLGETTVEDLTRLDTDYIKSDYKSGRFSPHGRGYAVMEGELGDSVVATRLVDFDAPRPKFIEMPQSRSGQTNQFGVWLDDHRIVAYESTDYRTSLAENCRIVDLERPDEVSVPFDFGINGARCTGYFEISPLGRWLMAFVELGAARALLIAPVENAGLGSWTKIADLAPNEAPATVSFGGDEQYVAIMKVLTGAGSLVSPIVVAKLGNPPVALQSVALSDADRPNYVMMAPTGPRMFVHTTRIIENNRGTNPILVFDLESRASGEVTSRYFPSSSPGFTAAGRGLLTYGYDNEFGSHGIEWLEITDPPGVAIPVALLGETVAPVRGGQLEPEGKRYYGISGSTKADFPSWRGPIDLMRFDFSPLPSSGTKLLRLSEYSNVDNWLFSPDLSALVYRVAVTTATYDSADPLTQGHYVSELGTYWASTSGTGPTRLGLTWSAYDHFVWLPDSTGLLRIAPEGEPLVVTDAYSNDGRGVSYVNQGDKVVLHWLRLDGGKGVVTDLSAYLGSNYRVDDSSGPDVPKSWAISD